MFVGIIKRAYAVIDQTINRECSLYITYSINCGDSSRVEKYKKKQTTKGILKYLPKKKRNGNDKLTLKEYMF